MTSDNRSLRGTFIPPSFDTAGEVENITDIVERLCRNLNLRAGDVLDTHSGKLIAWSDPDCIFARKKRFIEAVSDVKEIMYRIIAEKRELESEVRQEKRRRVELEDCN